MPKISEYLTGGSGAGAGEVTLLQFNAEVAERTAHGNAANPHSGSASVASLTALEEQVATHAARHALGGGDVITPDAIGAATAQALLDQAAAFDAEAYALATAIDLRVPVARVVSSTFPIQGGGGLSADRTLALVLAVVSELLTYGVALSGKVVTDQVLAAVTKLLISTNTTIYVATTGSDTTGDGSSGAPFASIAKALSSIAGKLIASGVTVTIQVADGTYSISSFISIDHPDGDKIQILGNTSAETTVPIAAIDTTAKTITVAGDYTGAIQVGNIIGLTGDVRTVAISSISGNVFTVSSDPTSKMSIGDTIYILNGSTAANIKSYVVTGLTSTTVTVSTTIPSTDPGGASLTATNQGAYAVSDRVYSGGNTIITCSAETIASATVGGGSIVIKPCNKCILSFTSGVHGFRNNYSKIKLINGFKIVSAGGAAYGIYVNSGISNIDPKTIIQGFNIGILAQSASLVNIRGPIIKSCSTGVQATNFSSCVFISSGLALVDGSTTLGIKSNRGSYIFASAAYVSMRGNVTDYSPALETLGNGDSMISQV